MRRPLMRPEVNGPEAGARAGRPAPRNGAAVQMPQALRATVCAVCAVLWVSGMLWLVLHYGFAQQTQFGPLPNPWEPSVMRLHGLLAVGAVFLLGWMVAGHVLTRWSSARNRISGIALAGSAALLIASGYALYYTTGTAHELASRLHEWLGTLAVLAAVAHWWRIRTPR